MERTTLKLGAVAAATLFLVAACGGDDPTPAPTPEADPTPAAAVATDAPADPTDAPADPTDAPADPTDAPADPTDAPADPTDAPAAPTDAPAAPTDAPAADDPPPTGPGTATITVGDESYSLGGILCAFSPEEARSERTSFTLDAVGAVDGTRVQMSAAILDDNEEGRLEGDQVTYRVEIDDIEDFENPAISWRATTGGFTDPTWTITLDGKEVTAEPLFDDGRTDEIETTAGTLEATCP